MELPSKAGDAVLGDAANVSRSLRSWDCCLRAELKREFCSTRLAPGFGVKKIVH